MTVAPLTVAAAVAKFLEWVQNHRARNTWLVRRGRLASLAARLGGMSLTELSLLDIENWLAADGRFPDGSLKSADTRRTTIISFNAWQQWCLDHGLLVMAVADRLKKPKGRERERIPTAEETAKLLAAATPAFRAIYEALRHSGARPSELCGARIEQLHPAGNTSRVLVLSDHKTGEKTGRDRRISIGAKLARLIDEAAAERTDGPIFLAEDGRPWSSKRLSERYRTLRDRLRLPKDLVLYLARHEHGTVITRKRGIHAAKEALGHTSIKTTQRYAHTTDAEKAADQEAFE